MLLIAIVVLLLGFGLLAFAAEKLVSGATHIAKHHGVSPLTIGITVVALGTSLPEIVVSIYAAVYGNPQLALGNAIGSNIANIGLVLGVTLLLIPMTIRSKVLVKELPLLFLIMLLASLLMFDGVLGRIDGIVLVFVFIGLIYWLFRRADMAATDFEPELVVSLSMPMAWVWLVVGIILLPLSSHLIVESAIYIAKYFGLSDLVIGLTIFALGTSLPELATSLAGAYRRQYDLVIGNIIGSNIFNLVAVLCLPAIIKPIPVKPLVMLRDLPVMFVITILLYLVILFSLKRQTTKWFGVLFILFYLVYLFLVFIH